MGERSSRTPSWGTAGARRPPPISGALSGSTVSHARSRFWRFWRRLLSCSRGAPILRKAIIDVTRGGEARLMLLTRRLSRGETGPTPGRAPINVLRGGAIPRRLDLEYETGGRVIGLAE